MSLTKPFFNAIPAFNATVGGLIQLNVLGGDTISAYGYSIYERDTGTIILTTQVDVSTDRASDEVRTFNISVGGNILTNNKAYNIIAYTSTASGVSPYSTPGLFYCYTTPTLSATITNLSGQVVNGNTAKVVLAFNKNDSNSPAAFSSASMTLYGKNKSTNEFDTLFSTGDVYELGTAIDVNGLVANVDSASVPIATAPYSEYQILGKGTTQDLTPLTFAITGLYCYYAQSTDASVFSAVNLPDEGKIKLTSNMAVASGTSTSAVSYTQDGNYYTANLSGNTATWHPTTLHEPFTARFWVGGLANNTEFATLKSDDYGGEIVLSYNNKKATATLKQGASTIRSADKTCNELTSSFEYFSSGFHIGTTGSYLTSVTSVGNQLYALYGTTTQDLYKFDGFNLGTKYEISSVFGSGADRIIGDGRYVYIFGNELNPVNKMGVFDTTSGVTTLVSLNSSGGATCKRLAQNANYVYLAGDFRDGDNVRSPILAYNKTTGMVERTTLSGYTAYQSVACACTQDKVYFIASNIPSAGTVTGNILVVANSDLSSPTIIPMTGSLATANIYDMFVSGGKVYFTDDDVKLWNYDLSTSTVAYKSTDIGPNNHILKYTNTQYCLLSGESGVGGAMQFYTPLTNTLSAVIDASSTGLGSFGMAYLIADGVLLVRSANYGTEAYYQQNPMTFVGVQCNSSMGLTVDFEIASLITFNSNGGSAIPDILTNSLLSASAPTPTKIGYTFGGWYLDSDLTTAVTYPYAPKRPVTLYAKWNS